MPTSNRRRVSQGNIDKSRRSGRFVMERASSFHGRASAALAEEAAARKQLQRPRTVPDLMLGRSESSEAAPLPVGEEQRPRLTKLLLNVTIRGSAGTLQLVMRLESTVGDLVSAAVAQYVKEGRRPVLATADPSCFDLHYSQFSLESLGREEKLVELGSRNFFVHLKKPEPAAVLASGTASASSSSSSAMNCSQEADFGAGSCFDWIRFMDFLL